MPIYDNVNVLLISRKCLPLQRLAKLMSRRCATAYPIWAVPAYFHPAFACSYRNHRERGMQNSTANALEERWRAALHCVAASLDGQWVPGESK